MSTRSPEPILPAERSAFKATKQAAASGATNRPSFDPTSRATRIISSSSTAMAPPLDRRRMSKIRKSPIAFGTRRPEATVYASGNSAAYFSPASKAWTIGAQPAACTANMRGRFAPIQPSTSISSNAFHIPMRPVPPPVGYKITSGNAQSHCSANS
jgi:hypothetical protein